MARSVIPVRDLPTGWTIATLEGRHVIPDYPYEAMAALLDEETRRQELDLDWTATSGKRVYPEFGRLHEAVEPLPHDANRPLVCGWDLPGGNGGTPAFVPSQLNAFGQWLIYPELVPDEDESIGLYEFGERVAQYLHEEFARPSGLPLEKLKTLHYGDPVGNAPLPQTLAASSLRLEKRSAYEVLRLGMRVPAEYDEETGHARIEEKPGWGWIVQPGEVSLTKRMEAVRARLKLLLSGQPALVVDPQATMVVEGFKGAYHYPQRTDGRYELDPAKNHHSHPMNALEYIASRLFALPGKDRDEDTPPPRPGMVYRPPGRRRYR